MLKRSRLVRNHVKAIESLTVAYTSETVGSRPLQSVPEYQRGLVDIDGYVTLKVG